MDPITLSPSKSIGQEPMLKDNDRRHKCGLKSDDTKQESILKPYNKTQDPILYSDNKWKPTLERQTSTETESSHCDTADEEDPDDEEADYFYDSEDNNYETMEMNGLLTQDIDHVRREYGDSAVKTTIYRGIDAIDVDLNFNMMSMNQATAQSWKIKTDQLLVVGLQFSYSQYLDNPSKPQVEVYQKYPDTGPTAPNNFSMAKNRFGIDAQLQMILENFIRQHWGTYLKNEAIEKSSTLAKNIDSVLACSDKNPCELFDNCTKELKTCSLTDKEEQYPTKLRQLVEMGIEEELARSALFKFDGVVESVIDVLLSSEGERELRSQKVVSPPPSFKTNGELSDKRSVNNFRSSIGIDICFDSTGFGDKRCEAKSIPDLKQGFLMQIVKYFMQRIRSVNAFCPICDEDHIFEGAMLKPAVCGRDLCIFSFQELGVMSDVAEDIASDPEVVDLLVVMAKAACFSRRSHKIFDPFPAVLTPGLRLLALDPRSRDLDLAQKALGDIMNMGEMARLQGNSLKETMNKRNVLSHPLLQWIISSNRSHIVKLRKSQQLDFMGTPHQFLLMSSPPAKEAAFRAAKAKYGSLFAFHGSSIENWHSIIRKGLLNASGSYLQLHGAAFGKGIYLSPDYSVSDGFSSSHQAFIDPHQRSDSQFLKQGGNLKCIAICEVINSKELRKSGNIWVMPNENFVCTRFFFVNSNGRYDIRTTEEPYLSEIKLAAAVSYD